MFTCFIRYKVDLEKIDEFKEYAFTWMTLIEKYGGTHHGYFIPGGSEDLLPEAKFSFPDLGIEGSAKIAVALFSFPNVEVYEKYRHEVPEDPECQRITARFNENKSFTKYERSFLIPIFNV
jgi:hypothetical protein